MSCTLPSHGRVECAICHRGQAYSFDETRTEADGWRITNNPLAFGNQEPQVIVLGFSKGPTQARALASTPFDQIAFKGGRGNLAKILHHVGLLPTPDARLVDEAIANRAGRFHFASLIRCTVERFDPSDGSWKGTGGGMLDNFHGTPFGRKVIGGCTNRFLGELPKRTRLAILLGMGSKGNYINACRRAIEQARPGGWRTINEVAYADDQLTVVHTEHFASQGALIPNWLSGESHPRGRFGLLAREAVALAMSA